MSEISKPSALSSYEAAAIMAATLDRVSPADRLKAVRMLALGSLNLVLDKAPKVTSGVQLTIPAAKSILGNDSGTQGVKRSGPVSTPPKEKKTLAQKAKSEMNLMPQAIEFNRLIREVKASMKSSCPNGQKLPSDHPLVIDLKNLTGKFTEWKKSFRESASTQKSGGVDQEMS